MDLKIFHLVFLLFFTIILAGQSRNYRYADILSNSLADIAPSTINTTQSSGYFGSSLRNKATDLRLINYIRHSNGDVYDIATHSRKWIFLHPPTNNKCASLEYTFKSPVSRIEFTPYNLYKRGGEAEFMLLANGSIVKTLSVCSRDTPKIHKINFRPSTKITIKVCKINEHRGSGVFLKYPRIF
jgi:hypothetical protein